MNAHQHGFVGLPFAFNQSDVLQVVALLAEGDEAEMTIFCRHVHFLALLDEAFVFQAIGNEVLDGDDV